MSDKRIDDLKTKLDTRRRLGGYEENVKEIQAEIARLEALKQD